MSPQRVLLSPESPFQLGDVHSENTPGFSEKHIRLHVGDEWFVERRKSMGRIAEPQGSTGKRITFIGMYYVQNGSFMILVSDLDPMWVRPRSRIELWIRLNSQMR